jgi:lipopolysaccharide biosynthesis glycosyltransferase
MAAYLYKNNGSSKKYATFAYKSNHLCVKMRILLTFNDAYAPHAAVVMESAVRNCPQKLGFAVIHYDISRHTQDTLARHFEGRIKGLEFFKVDLEKVENITKGIKNTFWNKNVVWLRMFAPSVLPQSENHIIYLDCDTIVCDNILQMTENARLSMPLCAITQYDPAYKWGNLNRHKYEPYENLYVQEAFFYRTYQNLGMHVNAPYFCTGVMIMNLNYWRTYGIEEQSFDFVKKYPNKIFAPDQDVLNAIINGNYCALHPRWNAITCNSITTNYPAQWLLEANSNPAIIHAKGWSHWGAPAVCKEYRKYRRLTPYPMSVNRAKLMYVKLAKGQSNLYMRFARCLALLLLRGKYELSIRKSKLASVFLDPITKQS